MRVVSIARAHDIRFITNGKDDAIGDRNGLGVGPIVVHRDDVAAEVDDIRILRPGGRRYPYGDDQGKERKPGCSRCHIWGLPPAPEYPPVWLDVQPFSSLPGGSAVGGRGLKRSVEPCVPL
jgi:hypothetical protein